MVNIKAILIMPILVGLAACSSDSGSGGQTSTSNQTPSAKNLTVDSLLNTSIVIDVLLSATDADGDSLVLASFLQAENGLVEVINSQLSYIPDSGFVGIDKFQYTISDGSDTDSATVTIRVEARIDLQGTVTAMANDLVDVTVMVGGSSQLLTEQSQNSYQFTINSIDPDAPVFVMAERSQGTNVNGDSHYQLHAYLGTVKFLAQRVSDDLAIRAENFQALNITSLSEAHFLGLTHSINHVDIANLSGPLLRAQEYALSPQWTKEVGAIIEAMLQKPSLIAAGFSLNEMVFELALAEDPLVTFSSALVREFDRIIPIYFNDSQFSLAYATNEIPSSVLLSQGNFDYVYGGGEVLEIFADGQGNQITNWGSDSVSWHTNGSRLLIEADNKIPLQFVRNNEVVTLNTISESFQRFWTGESVELYEVTADVTRSEAFVSPKINALRSAHYFRKGFKSKPNALPFQADELEGTFAIQIYFSDSLDSDVRWPVDFLQFNPASGNMGQIRYRNEVFAWTTNDQGEIKITSPSLNMKIARLTTINSDVFVIHSTVSGLNAQYSRIGLMVKESDAQFANVAKLFAVFGDEYNKALFTDPLTNGSFQLQTLDNGLAFQRIRTNFVTDSKKFNWQYNANGSLSLERVGEDGKVTERRKIVPLLQQNNRIYAVSYITADHNSDGSLEDEDEVRLLRYYDELPL